MSEYFECLNNNIFDIDSNDNNDNIYLNKNATFSNGFTINKSEKKCYIKKRIKNNSIRNRNNISNIEMPETISTEKIFYNPSETTHENFRIETIPIYNLKLSTDNDDQIYNKQKINIIKKNVKNLFHNIKKKNVNSSINEINISLKHLKKKNRVKNNSHKNIKTLKTLNSRNTSITHTIINNTLSLKSFTTLSQINPVEKIKQLKVNKNGKIDNKLTIQVQNRLTYIDNNEKIDKMIYLKKIIYKQNSEIKELREYNMQLIEKIKSMHDENRAILEIINSLKKEIDYKKNNHEDIFNPKNLIKVKCQTEQNENKNFFKIKEIKEIKNNNCISKNIIYSLYDNENILSYDFLNNQFKLHKILNEDFKNSFNKEINKLYLYNKINNKLYIVSGENNDQFYIFDINRNVMIQCSKLKNNHMFGGLLLSNQSQLICLSGNYNKKVEVYNQDIDTWDDKIIEEMPEERCNSCYLILNYNRIYGFFGYNFILNKYLNDIIYYDFNNNKWCKILENSLINNRNGIQNHFCYRNEKNNLINILGGDSNCSKIVIDLEKNNIIEIKENEKKYKFLFSNNSSNNMNNNFITLFDNNHNVHLINYFSDEIEIIEYK